VFGISEDRAQLNGKCSKNHLVKGGTVESKLSGYFNASCFASPPVIGADEIGTTAFGDSGTGIVNGPVKRTSSTFGVISGTTVNPRVGQLTLKFAF